MLAQRVMRKLPKRIIADKGYDWRALWDRRSEASI